MTSTVLLILASALILIGLLGTVLPVLPGIPLIFTGMVVIAWCGDFALIGPWTVAILAAITVIAIGVDVSATILGAKRVGASRKAMWGAGLGSLVGLFFGMPGLLAGPYFGAMAGEMVHGQPWRQASRVGLGTWLGLAIGAVLKVLLALLMLVIFGIALWLP